MIGRSGRLLLIAFVIVSSLTLCQDYRSVRVVPRLAFESSSAQLPGTRITPPVRSPITPPRVFRFPQLARASGIIFSGTVTKIERRKATVGQSVETVAVTFHVENAIRGVTSGHTLTITQWIGLWGLRPAVSLG